LAYEQILKRTYLVCLEGREMIRECDIFHASQCTLEPLGQRQSCLSVLCNEQVPLNFLSLPLQSVKSVILLLRIQHDSHCLAILTFNTFRRFSKKCV
jgi:hypothetical protein